MRFMVACPKFRGFLGTPYYDFPLGLAYVSAALKNGAFDVECLNLNHYDEPAPVVLAREVINREIDVVCTGGLSGGFGQIFQMVQSVRRANPYLRVVLGGGLISASPEITMPALRPDVGVIGEGEETIVDLARAWTEGRDLESVKGIRFFDRSGALVQTPERGPIEELDSLPYPDYEGFEISRYLDEQLATDFWHLYGHDSPRALPVIASRSCPFSCTFCYHPLGKKYRMRSFDSLFKEIDFLVNKYKPRTLAILDELLSNNRERIAEFCRRIKPYGLKWFAQVRVCDVDGDLLRMMKDAGCNIVCYGLESFSAPVLKSMRKHVTPVQIESALREGHAAKLLTQGNFLLGDPGETTETLQETLNWWINHLEYQVNIFPIDVFPGTPLWQTAVERGLIKNQLQYILDGFPRLNLSNMPDEVFAQQFQLWGNLIEFYCEQMPCAAIEEMTREAVDPARGTLYGVRFRCPLCNSQLEYHRVAVNGFRWYNRIPSISCRECNKRLMFPLSHHFKEIRTRVADVLQRSLGARLGVLREWDVPGVVHTRMLMTLGRLPPERVATVFRGPNPLGIQRTTQGVPERPLPEAAEEIKLAVDHVLISSESEEEPIYQQVVGPLRQAGIEVHRLYQRSY